MIFGELEERSHPDDSMSLSETQLSSDNDFLARLFPASRISPWSSIYPAYLCSLAGFSSLCTDSYTHIKRLSEGFEDISSQEECL